MKPTCQDSSTDAFDPWRRFANVDRRIAKGSFDHFVGAAKQRQRERQTKSFRGREVQH